VLEDEATAPRLARATLIWPPLTICSSGALFDGVFPESPPYAATML
jgi:hypothetical protein